MNNQHVYLFGDQSALVWKELSISEICPFIVEWRVTHLNIRFNFHSSIVKEIGEIRFSNIQFLDIQKNNI